MKRQGSFDEPTSADHGTTERDNKYSTAPSEGKDGTDKNTLNDTTELWITVIDVGQGESTLIRYRERKDKVWSDLHVALVDGGHSHFAKDTIIPTLDALGVTKINTMFCSHYDSDHLEGLAEIIKHKDSLAPDFVYERSTTAFGNENKVINFRKAYKTSQIIVGGKIPFTARQNSPFMECVWVDNWGEDKKLENDYSIGLLVKFGNFSFYLGGDLTSSIEDSLNLGGHVCAFKCGHHGSKHSTSTDFLNTITPTAAFISASSHSYCHPDDETIMRLYRNEAVKKIYLTNCVYNRAGINSDFGTKEDELKKRIFEKIIDWKKNNGALIEAQNKLAESRKAEEAAAKLRAAEAEAEKEAQQKKPKIEAGEMEVEPIVPAENIAPEIPPDIQAFDSFERILKIAGEQDYYDLICEPQLVIKIGGIRKAYPGTSKKRIRQKWTELSVLYFGAHDIHNNRNERDERTKPKQNDLPEEINETVDAPVLKGVVAASKAHLGNLHIVVSGEDALGGNLHKFTVYYSDGATTRGFAHKCGAAPELVLRIDKNYEKPVKRDNKYPFIPSFSLITGPSAEEKPDSLSKEADAFLRQLNYLLGMIDDTEEEIFLAQAQLVLDEKDLPEVIAAKITKFSKLYGEMIDFYDTFDNVDDTSSDTDQITTGDIEIAQPEPREEKTEAVVEQNETAQTDLPQTDVVMEKELKPTKKAKTGKPIDPTKRLQDAIRTRLKTLNEIKVADEDEGSYNSGDAERDSVGSEDISGDESEENSDS